MPTLADLFNVPREFEFEGIKYGLKEPDQLQQGQFQRWLEQRVRESIRRDTEAEEDELAKALDRFYDRQAAGEYEWGNPICLRALLTFTGWGKYLEIMLGVDPITARKMVEKPIEELAAAVGRAAAENPKLIGEVLASRGFPTDWLSELSSLFSATRPSMSRGPKSKRARTSNSGKSSPGTNGPAKDTQNSPHPQEAEAASSASTMPTGST
jgi:hypothetical protein